MTLMTEKFWKKDNDWILQNEETSFPHSPDPSDHSIKNLMKLNYINTPEILYHLHHHYSQKNIYTTAGKILLAINPFTVTTLYSDEIKQLFLNSVEPQYDNPHIYQTINNAIFSEETIQNFLISGESGSGKTETTKKILDYLSLRYKDANNILPTILEFNTILEAFGNASTQRNHNSSRFGKFIKINIENNFIYANIRTYLLEKVRLIGENLTNYHIFYAFGYEKNKKIYERDDWNTEYLQKDNLKMIWQKHMKSYDWNNLEKIIIFLIEVLENKKETVYGNIEKLLSEKTLKVGEELIKVPLDKNGSKNVRDTLVMIIYDKLFQNIVCIMNEKLGDKITYNKSYGILDIFGFEVFNENGFEQLCINYTNEALQSIFNRFVFEEEIKLFEEEGILKSKITFENNIDKLEFFDKFFSLLDEKTIVGAKDSDLIISLPNNKKIISKKIDSFIIMHYADNVEYKLGEFTDKNMENINYDIQKFMNNILQFPIDKMAHKKKKGGINTITSKFRDELNILINDLNNSYLYFIRCIKPNDENLPNVWNSDKVEEQLNYCGIINALNLARQAYPVRMKKDVFIHKYKFYFMSDQNFDQILSGKTMFFMTNNFYNKINNELKITQNLGKYVKMYYYHKQFQNIILKIKLIQKNWKIGVIYKKYKKMQNRMAQIISQNYRNHIAKQKLKLVVEAEAARLAAIAEAARLAAIAEAARLAAEAEAARLAAIAEAARLAAEAEAARLAAEAEAARLAAEAEAARLAAEAEAARLAAIAEAARLEEEQILKREYKNFEYKMQKKEMELNDIIINNKLNINRLEEIIIKRNNEYNIIFNKFENLQKESVEKDAKIELLNNKNENKDSYIQQLEEDNNEKNIKIQIIEKNFKSISIDNNSKYNDVLHYSNRISSEYEQYKLNMSEYYSLIGDKLNKLLDENIQLKDENSRLLREIRQLQNKKWYDNFIS